MLLSIIMEGCPFVNGSFPHMYNMKYFTFASV